MRTILSIVYDIVFHIERKINYFILFIYLFIYFLLSEPSLHARLILERMQLPIRAE